MSVLAYHGVSAEGPFRIQLESLAAAGHTFISADDLRSWIDGGALPSNPLLVTFDDGDRSVLENGLPVLQDLGIPGLLFVVSGLLDTDTPFWWHEVEELSPDPADEVRRLKTVPNDERLAKLKQLRFDAGRVISQPQLTTQDLMDIRAAGVEIGNHTFDHPCLDMCDDDEVESQIISGHAALVERGITPSAFAYPNGNLDERAEPVLERLGYDLGFLFDHRHTRVDQPALRQSRLRLDADASPDRAELIVSGVHGAIMRLRRRS